MQHDFSNIETNQKKGKLLVAGTLIYGILYVGVSKILIFEPRIVPESIADVWIGFHPWTVWIYLSIFFFLPFVYWKTTDAENLKHLIEAFFTVTIISTLIFWFLPTTVPRIKYDVAAFDENAFHAFAMELVRKFDEPVNCIPSLHASMPTLFVLAFFRERKPYFWAIAIWGFLIIWSAMSTKQHHVIDIFTGMSLATIVYFGVLKFRGSMNPKSA